MTEATTEQPPAEPTAPQEPAKTETQPEVDEILQTLLSKMTPITESKNNLKILIWGEPDAGKTTGAATAPNNLFCDAEDGTTSLSNNPELLGKGSQRYPVRSVLGFETLLKYLHDENPAFDWVETLTIDTLSNLHKKGLSDTLEREHRRNPLGVNLYKAETEHHTENNEHIRRIVDSLKDLNRNVIITAHARIVEQKNKPTRIFPDFSEKLASAIVSYVDIAVYVEKRKIDDEIKRVWRFRTDSTYLTKCRIDSLPDEAVDVTWDKLWNAWQAHLAKAKAAAESSS